jgi:hypothetical protein
MNGVAVVDRICFRAGFFKRKHFGVAGVAEVEWLIRARTLLKRHDPDFRPLRRNFRTVEITIDIQSSHE